MPRACWYVVNLRLERDDVRHSRGERFRAFLLVALATRRGVTRDRASTLLFASLSPLPSVMGYTLHAGQALEEIPQRRGPLNLHGVKGWYDFYASQVSVDSEGYCDAKTVGMKHVAVRDDGRSSAFRPNPGNIGPRKKDWKVTSSNTQKGASIRGP